MHVGMKVTFTGEHLKALLPPTPWCGAAIAETSIRQGFSEVHSIVDGGVQQRESRGLHLESWLN